MSDLAAKLQSLPERNGKAHPGPTIALVAALVLSVHGVVQNLDAPWSPHPRPSVVTPRREREACDSRRCCRGG